MIVSHPAHFFFLHISDTYIEEKAKTYYKHNESKRQYVFTNTKKEEEECHMQEDDNEMNDKWDQYRLLSVQVSTASAKKEENFSTFAFCATLTSKQSNIAPTTVQNLENTPIEDVGNPLMHLQHNQAIVKQQNAARSTRV
ncbi:hypothetical protein KIN20_015837 [Parelaphostrongylus tenuis]|uniref:Uncharacterized protein n=1 Tax=Parelaphostrongylus tenuis TaxID=148309 RepID=A0AAD5MZ23_PARTN|nr:hypothetical protein KIN20_015837 [Parelaphostrongylus tenuis]